MHSFELHESINNIFSSSESIQPFIEGVSILAKASDYMNKHLIEMSCGGSRASNGFSEFNIFLENLSNKTSAIKNKNFFKAIEQFKALVSEIESDKYKNENFITSIKKQVDVFGDIYDDFIASRSKQQAILLLNSAKMLSVNLEAFFGSLQFFKEATSFNEIPSGSEDTLTLWLPSHIDLTDFSNKLLAIQKIYSELCMLLSVSEVDYPLRISKIESGSFWGKFLGHAVVIGLMTSFIADAASWSYRNYTIEGKISAIPRKVEAIDALLGLTQRLNEQGINTSEMKSHIEKSAVEISKDLTIIVSHQSKVVVNNQTISFSSEQHKLYNEQVKHLQLESGSGFNQNDSENSNEMGN